MITEAHEIREKQSANRTHVINNVAIKGQNNADDSVSNYVILHKSNIKHYARYMLIHRMMMTVREL